MNAKSQIVSWHSKVHNSDLDNLKWLSDTVNHTQPTSKSLWRAELMRMLPECRTLSLQRNSTALIMRIFCISALNLAGLSQGSWNKSLWCCQPLAHWRRCRPGWGDRRCDHAPTQHSAYTATGACRSARRKDRGLGTRSSGRGRHGPVQAAGEPAVQHPHAGFNTKWKKGRNSALG